LRDLAGLRGIFWTRGTRRHMKGFCLTRLWNRFQNWNWRNSKSSSRTGTGSREILELFHHWL